MVMSQQERIELDKALSVVLESERKLREAQRSLKLTLDAHEREYGGGSDSFVGRMASGEMETAMSCLDSARDYLQTVLS